MQCHYKLAKKLVKMFRLLLKVKVKVDANQGRLKLTPRKYRTVKMCYKGKADNKKKKKNPHILDNHLNKFPCVKHHITYSKATFLF